MSSECDFEQVFGGDAKQLLVENVANIKSAFSGMLENAIELNRLANANPLLSVENADALNNVNEVTANGSGILVDIEEFLAMIEEPCVPSMCVTGCAKAAAFFRLKSDVASYIGDDSGV